MWWKRPLLIAVFVVPHFAFAAESNNNSDLPIIGIQARCDRWAIVRDASKADSTGPYKDQVMVAKILNESTKGWALGFMSGLAWLHKATGGPNVLANVTEDAVLSKIEAECRNKPLEPVRTAVSNVFLLLVAGQNP